MDKAAKRKELRSANLAAWNRKTTDADGSNKALDPSLKRNTAYIKRLRTSLHSAESVPILIKESTLLSLEKYTSELVAAALEGLSRAKVGSEIWGVVEVLSALHSRFPKQFTVPFTAHFLALLQPTPKAQLAALQTDQREKEENARVSRQRNLHRILGELEAVAVIKGIGGKGTATGEDTNAVLRDLLSSDKETLVNCLPLAVAFTKHLGPLYLPTNLTEDPTPAETSAPVETADFDPIPAAQKDSNRKLLVSYYDQLCKRVTKDRLHMLETDKRNHEAYIRSGEIFEDRAQTYERLVKTFDKLWSGTQSLSELLNLPLPDLPTLPTTTIVTGTAALHQFNLGQDGDVGGAKSLWADEEEKRFYEDIVDLKDEVPSLLLGVNPAALAEKKAAEEAAQVEKVLEDEVEVVEQVADAEEEEEGPSRKALAEAETADPIAAAPAARLADLFARLPDMNNRNAIDRAAVEFAFLNSKATQNRLIKFLAAVPRNRLDILPYYARLVGTLHRYIPEVGNGIVAILEDDFRYLQKRKNLEMRELRGKTTAFLGELTKFKVTPDHSILHCYKVCIDDMSAYNVDSLSMLLENCGRFLLRTEGTSEKMASLLDIMLRKKAAQNLDARQVAMLDNAFYQCSPPERPAIAPKEYTPMELFIHHVMYNVLTRPNYEKALKLVRSLDWDDDKVVHRLRNCFVKIWKAKFSSIALFSLMLHDVGRYHSDFLVGVIDRVLESVRVGLARNIFKHNQMRIATIKYLGELFNFQVLDQKIIFDTLWLLISYGHPDGRPWPDTPSPIDGPDDWFRVRMVCTLLDTTVEYLDRGQWRKRLDNFLVFFQFYIKCKTQAPMDIEFALSDLFENIRPKLTLFKTFGEAAEAVDALLESNQAMAPELPAIGDINSDDSDEESIRDFKYESDNEDVVVEPPNEPETEELPSLKKATYTEEEESDFARDLAKMMSESLAERPKQGNKGSLAGVSIPYVRKQQAEQAAAKDDGFMAFTLLGRKGAKAQTRELDIPVEAAIAMRSRTQQMQDKAEQQEVKRLVLQSELRQNEAEKQAFHDDMVRRGVKFKQAKPRQQTAG